MRKDKLFLEKRKQQRKKSFESEFQRSLDSRLYKSGETGQFFRSGSSQAKAMRDSILHEQQEETLSQIPLTEEIAEAFGAELGKYLSKDGKELDLSKLSP